MKADVSGENALSPADFYLLWLKLDTVWYALLRLVSRRLLGYDRSKEVYWHDAVLSNLAHDRKVDSSFNRLGWYLYACDMLEMDVRDLFLGR